MARIVVGCAGWNYSDWIGPFYPKGLSPEKQLEYYARVFNFNEINSTFYSLPKNEWVKRWRDQTPKNFRFAVKVWQDITHKILEPDLDLRVDAFFTRLKPLLSKTTTFLLQFPPRFQFSEHARRRLITLTEILPRGSQYRFVFEFRHDSWFAANILEPVLDGHNKILGTVYLEGIRPEYRSNQGWYYIRLIGDRQISVFNRTQRSQEVVEADLLERVKHLRENQGVKFIFVVYNNHFRGFAPRDANEFKRILELPTKPLSNQRKLLDFMGTR